jgi:AraC family transcriptional regulator
VDWLDSMKKAIQYLEDRLDAEIDMEEAARVACSSKFHYQRMFHMLTGVTVAEYVRRRRLTLAAQDLASSSTKVIDVALKYGYDSPESFAKAFQKVHGITPSSARELGVMLKAYPRLSFHIALIGDKDMNYRIVEKEAFQVVGKLIRVSCRDGENQRRISQFWKESHEQGFIRQLEELSNNADNFGICMDFDSAKEELSYMIAIERIEGSLPADWVDKVIPAATWAVFESVGAMPNAIQNVWKQIYTEWFPSMGYEHAGGPELEVYPAEDAYDDSYRCEVWIPIKKK